MSLISKMKMRSTIKRVTSKVKDNYGNFKPVWTQIDTDVRCFIYSLEYATGKMLIGQTGQNFENLFLGIFNAAQNILKGDQVISTGFGNLYARSVNPITSGKTGKTHHIEVTMSIDQD